MSISADQIIGISAGVLTSVSSLPQVIKIIKEKEAKDVSLKMVIILLIGVCLWITYGIFKNDLAIIITNGLSFAINLILIFLRVIYGTK